MDPVIIDVREPDEYASGHVKGAVNIPLGQLTEGVTGLDDLSKDTRLIVYCRSGSRSGVAKKALQQQGYTDVTNGINRERVEAQLGA